MSNVVIPPTPAIVKLANQINVVIGSFVKARATVHLGKWEAEIEASNLFNLVIRNIEGITELANCDLVLLPAANVLARAVFEIAVKAAWMVQPDDPFQREVRWLAHLTEEARTHDRIAIKVDKFGGDAEFFRSQAKLLESFRKGVAMRLPAGVAELAGNPSVEAMLESVGQTKVYSVYTLLAAYVHGTHASTWIYRRNLGTQKELGEFIRPKDWYLPLWTSWKTIQVLGSYLLDRLRSDHNEFVDVELSMRIDEACSSISR